MIDPENCWSMADVRRGVDELDEVIVGLLGKRFRFMEAAARIKSERDQVRDEARKQSVLDHVRAAARQMGAPVQEIEHLYEALIEASIAYEFKRFDAR